MPWRWHWLPRCQLWSAEARSCAQQIGGKCAQIFGARLGSRAWRGKCLGPRATRSEGSRTASSLTAAAAPARPGSRQAAPGRPRAAAGKVGRRGRAATGNIDQGCNARSGSMMRAFVMLCTVAGVAGQCADISPTCVNDVFMTGTLDCSKSCYDALAGTKNPLVTSLGPPPVRLSACPIAWSLSTLLPAVCCVRSAANPAQQSQCAMTCTMNGVPCEGQDGQTQQPPPPPPPPSPTNWPPPPPPAPPNGGMRKPDPTITTLAASKAGYTTYRVSVMLPEAR
eukprot:COSAG06_NODE_1257_length_10084_cov_3.046770_1_plen_280_part_10